MTTEASLLDRSRPSRPAYKATEVGLLPDDWELRDIGDLKPFVTSGSRGWATHYSDVGSPFVRITNVSRDCIYLNLADLKFVHLPPGLSEADRTEIENGDVLISITADIGIVGYVDSRLPKPAYINQHLALVRLDSTRTDSKFLSYFLASEGPQRLFHGLTDQGAKAGMSLVTIRKLKVAHPALQEQRAISTALSDVDGLIDALDKLISKKHSIRLATAQQLLAGAVRLPAFRGEKSRAKKETAVGYMPQDWDAVELGDLFAFKNGLNKGKRFFGYGTPIVNYMDVYSRRGLRSADLHGRVSVSPQELKAFGVRRGDVFFTRTSETADEVGITSVMLNDVRDTVFSGFVLRARPRDESLDDAFKQYCFSTASVRQQIVAQTTETTRALTNGRYLSTVVIRRPPKEEQRAIAAVLSDLEAEIAALERRRDKTKAVKHGMMQALLTGRVRLVKPEAAA